MKNKKTEKGYEWMRRKLPRPQWIGAAEYDRMKEQVRAEIFKSNWMRRAFERDPNLFDNVMTICLDLVKLSWGKNFSEQESRRRSYAAALKGDKYIRQLEQSARIAKHPRRRDSLSDLLERALERLERGGVERKPLEVIRQLGDHDDHHILRAYPPRTNSGTQLNAKDVRYYYNNGKLHWFDGKRIQHTSAVDVRKRILTARKHIKTAQIACS